MCVIFSVFPPRCPHASNSLSGIFFSPPLSSSLHLAFPLPVNPHCLIHSACVVSSIWPTDRTCITLLPRRNCHLNKSVLGGVISSICLVLPVFFFFFRWLMCLMWPLELTTCSQISWRTKQSTSWMFRTRTSHRTWESVNALSTGLKKRCTNTQSSPSNYSSFLSIAKSHLLINLHVACVQSRSKPQ